MELYEAYNILELNIGSSIYQIQKKYRELAKKNHPDICKKCGKKMYYINEAYKTIINNFTIKPSLPKNYFIKLNVIDYINHYEDGYIEYDNIKLYYKNIFINNKLLTYFFEDKNLSITIEIISQPDIHNLPSYHFNPDYSILYIFSNQNNNPITINNSINIKSNVYRYPFIFDIYLFYI